MVDDHGPMMRERSRAVVGGGGGGRGPGSRSASPVVRYQNVESGDRPFYDVDQHNGGGVDALEVGRDGGTKRRPRGAANHGTLPDVANGGGNYRAHVEVGNRNAKDSKLVLPGGKRKVGRIVGGSGGKGVNEDERRIKDVGSYHKLNPSLLF